MTHVVLASLMFGLLVQQGEPPAPAKPATPAAPMTEAERIIRIRETIDRTRGAVQKLEKEVKDPKGEYAIAEQEFEKISEEVKKEQEAIAKVKDSGEKAELEARQMKLMALETKLEEARQRFNIAIQQRKAMQDSITALKVRLEQEQKELDRLEGRTPMPKPGTNGEPPAQAPLPTPVPTPTPEAKSPAIPIIPGLPTPLPAAPEANGKPQPVDEEVKKAEDALQKRLAAVRDAEEKAASAADRVKAVQMAIDAATRALETERLATDQIQGTLARLTEQLQTNPPTDVKERQDLARRMTEASQRIAASRDRIRTLTDKLALLNEERHNLEAEQTAALREAEAKRNAADQAKSNLEEIQNPFTSRNIARWTTSHGPNLLVIFIVTSVLYLFVRLFSASIVRAVTRTGHRGTEEDRENRASTLTGVFRYIMGLLIIGGGLVMLLDEAGIPIVPLMGGAAVFGLAVAFGAQNLIKDYFSGFMMLMEDQYGVNDVVKIGNTSGLVEKITLRMTVLRDLEGNRHFIPHGAIGQVTNMTHTWSRAMFDVPVAYDENVDRVMSVLMDLAREMRQDMEFGLYIIDDPEMLGVDAFEKTAVIIKFLIKTRPLKQWLVKREMLRRIKNRFDQMGIHIPVQHQTLFHKFPEGLPALMPAHESYEMHRAD